MEESLLARLRANAGLLALVSDRIDWIERPQGDALPGVTLQVIDPGRHYTLDGYGLNGTRVQIDSWGSIYDDAKLVARAVLEAIEPAATQGAIEFSRSFLDGGRDHKPVDLPGGGKVFGVSQDFIIWWKSTS